MTIDPKDPGDKNALVQLTLLGTRHLEIYDDGVVRIDGEATTDPHTVGTFVLQMASQIHRSSMCPPPGAGEALEAAIRTFTVETPLDMPKGKAEAAMELLVSLMHPDAWPSLTASARAHLDLANGAAAVLCTALADDTRALRHAAEGFFGCDFREAERPV